MSVRDDLLAVRDSLTATLDGCNALLAVPAPDISCLPANIDETKTISEEAGFQRGYGLGVAEGEQNGFDIGAQFGRQQAEDEFWGEYQKNGGKVSYAYAFAGPRWTDATYNPKYPIIASAANNAFNTSYITDTKVTVDCSACGSNAATMFQSSKVQTIPLWIVNASMKMDTQLTSCTALTHLIVGGTIGRNFSSQWCPLDRESAESVMAALSDTATGQTATFNKAAVEAAFTTDEWETLVATKPNWTITLSA